MKNIIMLLGVVASSLVLAGCACRQAAEPAPVDTHVVPVHHDYKGEVGK